MLFNLSLHLDCLQLFNAWNKSRTYFIDFIWPSNTLDGALSLLMYTMNHFLLYSLEEFKKRENRWKGERHRQLVDVLEVVSGALS